MEQTLSDPEKEEVVVEVEDAPGGKFLRQLDIFDPTDDTMQAPIQIIGAGAIGSFTTLALAKLGLDSFLVYDDDVVEEHNQPSQLYSSEDIVMAESEKDGIVPSKLKVDALQELIKRLTDVDISVIPEKWDGQPLSGIVISALDNMAGRSALWEACRYNADVDLFIDTRIGGSDVMVFTIDPMDMEHGKKYKRFLFSSDEVAELPCTARGIIDINFMVGSLVTRAVRRFLKDHEITPFTTYSAVSGILTHYSWE